MQQCTVKKPRRCLWFTKENKDELLKIEEPDIYRDGYDFQIRETDEYICIDHSGIHKTFYYYNHWYAEECFDSDYRRFQKYSDKDFKEAYNLIQ